MFDDEHVALRISRIEHQLLEKDDHEHPLVVVTFELNPLSPERAAQISEFCKATLFSKADGTIHPQLFGATFEPPVKPQEIALRVDPSMAPTLVIDEAKIGRLHARRSKKTSSWRLLFTATFEPQNEHQLASMVDLYTKTPYCTFANAHPDLFDMERGKERRRTRKAHAGAAGAEAALQ